MLGAPPNLVPALESGGWPELELATNLRATIVKSTLAVHGHMQGYKKDCKGARKLTKGVAGIGERRRRCLTQGKDNTSRASPCGLSSKLEATRLLEGSSGTQQMYQIKLDHPRSPRRRPATT